MHERERSHGGPARDQHVAAKRCEQQGWIGGTCLHAGVLGTDGAADNLTRPSGYSRCPGSADTGLPAPVGLHPMRGIDPVDAPAGLDQRRGRRGIGLGHDTLDPDAQIPVVRQRVAVHPATRADQSPLLPGLADRAASGRRPPAGRWCDQVTAKAVAPIASARLTAVPARRRQPGGASQAAPAAAAPRFGEQCPEYAPGGRAPGRDQGGRPPGGAARTTWAGCSAAAVDPGEVSLSPRRPALGRDLRLPQRSDLRPSAAHAA
jgi:hypothetical protein